MLLEKGMLIKTNYSGPYRIKRISKGASRSSDTYAGDSQNPAHVNLVCTRPNGTGEFYLNRYDEETLLSLDKTCCGMKETPDHDWIEVLECDQPIQMSMF